MGKFRSSKKNEVGPVESAGYCSIEVGNQFVWTMISTYLSIFYTDVVGLAPAVVSMIFLVARIWDAVNDPMMGAITERTHTKWGKFRPYLIFGAPVVAILSILTFVKIDASTPAMIAYAVITYIGCGMAYTVVCISQGGLVNVMTRNIQTRVQLNALRQMGSGITGLIISAVAMPLILLWGNGSTSSAAGYFRTNILFAILGCVCVMFGGIVCKERISSAKTGSSAKLKDTFIYVFTNKDVLLILIAAITTSASILGRMGILSYWFIYYIGDAELMSPVLVCYNLATILIQFAVPWLTKRMDKKTACILSYALQCISLVLLFIFSSKSVVFIYIFSILLGCSNFAPTLLNSLAGELVDKKEVKTGDGSAGMMYSVISLGTKIGSAIGGAVGVALLGAVGYVANAEQSASVLRGMNMVTNLSPIILVVVGAICIALVDMTNKQSDENRRILEAREREKAEETEKKE